MHLTSPDVHIWILKVLFSPLLSGLARKQLGVESEGRGVGIPTDWQNVILVEFVPQQLLNQSFLIKVFFLGAQNLRWQTRVRVLAAPSDRRRASPRETPLSPPPWSAGVEFSLSHCWSRPRRRNAPLFRLETNMRMCLKSGHV